MEIEEWREFSSREPETPWNDIDDITVRQIKEIKRKRRKMKEERTFTIGDMRNAVKEISETCHLSPDDSFKLFQTVENITL